MKSYLTTAFLLTIRPAGTRAFADFSPVHPGRSTTGTGSTPCTDLCATTAPKRIGENADGVLYVNDRCINCAACSHFAPDVFARAPTDTCHIVARQPSVDDAEQIDRSRAALSACPVSAIRVERPAGPHRSSGGDEELARSLAVSPGRNGCGAPFPRPLLAGVDTGVYFLGSHNSESFGATPYLVRGRSHDGSVVSVMVDAPRFTGASIRAVRSLLEEESSGLDYLFLTHVDDTADHFKWREEFPSLKRIFHSGDLGAHNWLGDTTLEDVEVLLEGAVDGGDEETFRAWNLDGDSFDVKLGTEVSWPDEAKGDFCILHTPGHSPGSISLLYRSGSYLAYSTIFTGDTFAYSTRDGGHMSGFPRYGNSLQTQSSTIKKIGKIAGLWDVVAPGHGLSREYISISGDTAKSQAKQEDVDIVIQELAICH